MVVTMIGFSHANYICKLLSTDEEVQKENEELGMVTLFSKSFLIEYESAMGNFDLEYIHDYKLYWLMYILFFASTLFVLVIMFNLLVSILSDTYDRVQENQRASNLNEKGEGLVGVDEAMVQKRLYRNRYPNYLFATFMKGYDEKIVEDAWEGKIKAIKK